jgi:hypothetical protein
MLNLLSFNLGCLVIVYFGGNDSMRPHPSGLSPHVPLPEYVENMRNIAIHLKVIFQATVTFYCYLNVYKRLIQFEK